MSTTILVLSPALLGAYLLGSVPFGLILAGTVAGVDVRAGGSKNIGATNVARLAGKKLGVATLLLDASKGLVPVLLMAMLLGHTSPLDGGVGEAGSISKWWLAGAGAAAFLGHCFPVWLAFRGGKGVATALGVLIAMAPWSALVGALTFGLLFYLRRIPSLGSMAGVVMAIPVAFFTAGAAAGVLVIFMGTIVILKHRENIGRLISGTESRL